MTIDRDSRLSREGRDDALVLATAVFLYGLVFLLAGLCAAVPARADDAATRSAIVRRLTDWAAAFNARDVAKTCDLFSADLVSTMSGRADEGRAAVCGRIAAALANQHVAIRNVPEIEEIIVRDDLAVVRLTWLVSTTRGAVTDVSKERGMDIFRREADGQWRILRFVAFTAAPSDGAPAR